MAAQSGRDLVVKVGSAVVAMVRNVGETSTFEPTDITSDDDDGYRTFGDWTGTASKDLTLDGVWENANALQLLVRSPSASKLLTNVTIEDGEFVVAGDFFLQSFERSGSHDGEVTYTATLQSSGAWTETALPT